MELKEIEAIIDSKYPRYLLTTKEAADKFQTTSKGIQKLIKEGKLKKVGSSGEFVGDLRS